MRPARGRSSSIQTRSIVEISGVSLASIVKSSDSSVTLLAVVRQQHRQRPADRGGRGERRRFAGEDVLEGHVGVPLDLAPSPSGRTSPTPKPRS